MHAARNEKPGRRGKYANYVNAPQSQNSHPARTITGITAPSVEPTLPGSAVPGNAWEKAVVRPVRSGAKPAAQLAGKPPLLSLLIV
jgi:hypothetical protein